MAAGWVQKPAKANVAVEDSEFVDETDALISGLEAIQVGSRYVRCCAKAFRTERDSLIGCFVCRTTRPLIRTSAKGYRRTVALGLLYDSVRSPLAVPFVTAECRAATRRRILSAMTKAEAMVRTARMQRVCKGLFDSLRAKSNGVQNDVSRTHEGNAESTASAGLKRVQIFSRYLWQTKVQLAPPLVCRCMMQMQPNLKEAGARPGATFDLT